ncbi:MAG TPA: phosphoribosylglycinamide formyltransferase [Nevskiaceae bacterium]|nr:phosphoribosylglycinamide formyltransferase [Nevskiaceae bacterium]
MPETASPARLVVLISGQGRNLQALIEAQRSGRLPAELVEVISNRPDAAGLDRARAAGLPSRCLPHQAYADRAAFDAALARAIDAARPDWVILAGFMRILSPGFVRRYAGRLLNIHPSLLPRHPGLRTHEAVIAAGDTEHGASVHLVTEALDGGPVLVQGRLRVNGETDPVRLAERVMSEVEQRIYPQALAWLLRGVLRVDEGGLVFRGARRAQPPGLADLDPEFQ